MQLVHAIPGNWKKNNIKRSNTLLIEPYCLRSSHGKIWFLIWYWKARFEKTLLHYKFFTQWQIHVANIIWKKVWFEGFILEGHLCITIKSYHKDVFKLV